MIFRFWSDTNLNLFVSEMRDRSIDIEVDDLDSTVTVATHQSWIGDLAETLGASEE